MLSSLWMHRLLKPSLTGLGDTANLFTFMWYCLCQHAGHKALCFSEDLPQGSGRKPVRSGHEWQVQTPCQNAPKARCRQLKEWVPNCNGDLKMLKMPGMWDILQTATASLLPERKPHVCCRWQGLEAWWCQGNNRGARHGATSWIDPAGFGATFFATSQFIPYKMGTFALCLLCNRASS